ncbi:hypothetical protein BGX38DRAFT_1110016 [Terfezia claveryi]|nr:hypothetical protein BGX38DRAFT_1110016 [Terfezia claveryi]
MKPLRNALWTQKGIIPPLIVRGDILHNILLGVLKYLMEWIEGFLWKYKRLEAFDKIWENIPPYSGYRQPQKRYWQITMWSGAEMRGINRVILACFAAALRQIKDIPSLSAAGQADAKIVIRCVRALTDFCLIAQYRSHTPQTIEYMNQYLQEFHQFKHIFGEFRATGTFNFPKLHLLSHYDSQIIDFGTLPQYSTEITEALCHGGPID